MLITSENIDLLFSENSEKNEEKTQIYQVEICNIHPFKNHPYKVVFNEEMQELMNSIKEYGILEPLKLRKDEIGFEVISGHRRLHSAMRLGLKTVPATVYEISRDEAAVMLVDSNLHREHILPSEKAFAYKMKYEALKHQGKRTDLTSGQFVPKSDENRTMTILGEDNKKSYKTVQRYIRLTNLIPEILDLMDENEIAFSVGVELSYLSENMQNYLCRQMEFLDCKPSYAQANYFHKQFNNGTLTEEIITEVLSREKPNQRETIKIPTEKLKGKIPNSFTKDQAEDFVIKAVEYYHRYLMRQRENLR